MRLENSITKKSTSLLAHDQKWFFSFTFGSKKTYMSAIDMEYSMESELVFSLSMSGTN